MDGMLAIKPCKCVLDVAALIIEVEYIKLVFMVYTDGTEKKIEQTAQTGRTN